MTTAARRTAQLSSQTSRAQCHTDSQVSSAISSSSACHSTTVPSSSTQVVVVAVLADRDHAAINAGIPGVGGNVRQVGVGLRVGDGHRLQAAVDHVADGQQKFSEDKRNVDEQLFFDFHQLVFVGQLQGDRYRFVGFTQLFDDFFHVRDPLADGAVYMGRFIQ